LDPQLITAIVALITAITTLIKVLQHGQVLTDTRDAVNGQAKQLDIIAIGTAKSAESLDRSATSLEKTTRPNSEPTLT
jgi:hypothetical protein